MTEPVYHEGQHEDCVNCRVYLEHVRGEHEHETGAESADCVYSARRGFLVERPKYADTT